jgi:hypothetical protein
MGERQLENPQQPAHEDFGTLLLTDPRDKNPEGVSPQPRHDSVRLGTLEQSLGYLKKQGIARLIAKTGIDTLKTVQIDVKNRSTQRSPMYNGLA